MLLAFVVTCFLFSTGNKPRACIRNTSRPPSNQIEIQDQVEVQRTGELVLGDHVEPPWLRSRSRSASLKAGGKHLPGHAI